MGSVPAKTICRVIVEGERPAAENMARDEAILRAAASGGGVTLRFYRWRPWALSLGYFQKHADFVRYESDGIPVVRRLTGGGAIFHANEITYSLVGPFGQAPFPSRAAGIFEQVHETICEGLAVLGVKASLWDGPTGASPLICFSRPQRYDVVVEGRKLLGSAQRRRGQVFLQHGSLPLSANRFAPEATSLGEIIGSAVEESAIIEALVGAFARRFGWESKTQELSAGEEAEAARLTSRKYESDAWNRRR